MFCKKCGKELEDGTKFCGNCGQKVDDEVTQEDLKQESDNNKPKKKFWEKTWFTWLMLFFVPPVGIILLWKNSVHHIVARIFITIIFSLGFINAYIDNGFIDRLENKTQRKNVNVSTNYEKPKPIIYEKVSINELEKQLGTNAARAQQNWQGKNIEISGPLGVIDANGEYFTVNGNGFLSSVHCSIMNDKQKQILIKKNKGEMIKVKGRITKVGEIAGYRIEVAEME